MGNQMSDDINAIFARGYEDSLTNPLVKIDLETGAQFCLIMSGDSKHEGYVRMWIEEKGSYGYTWQTKTGELLDSKPETLN